MPSAKSSSNWDFTAVIDLIHTPTNPTSHLDRPWYREPTIDSDRGQSESNSQPKDIPHQDAGHRRLGDFGSLWDLINQPPRLVFDSHDHVEPVEAVDCDTSPRKLSSADLHPSQTPPLFILRRRDARTKIETSSLSDHDAALSDTSTGDSDGDVSVFDSPVPRPSSLSFIPPQVGSPSGKSDPVLTPPSSCDELDGSFNTTSPKHLGKASSAGVPSTKYKSSAERKAGLMIKLLKQFPEFAVQISSSQKHSGPSSKIHVFVDSSNIMIGFHDCYKISHNIPVTTRIRRLPLSFHNFSLILERGRPAAKRVLVGSDRFAAINEAERIGYETNILDRVHKAKQWTPRQLKFRNALSHGVNSGSEMGSSPEERWVEQGVDEILHLKMLESLVDAEKPATMVLATGDAAEAEYSGGFLKMVERALHKGWTVELVSFASNTSFAYKRKEFRAKWGSRFKMINLEDYVEELLDV
ncbi:hypothetical protein VTN77DRAFT_8813 [Rasamsonia byssochlamydoides]|uniref:uncharacterized protein n=1 Tax=Rasamsonia byssochlamydoides TaxID=89139 RepID=UPI003741EBE5